MNLLQQYNLANDTAFKNRVTTALIHTAIAVSTETLNDVQTISISGSPTGGTFTLTYSGQTTSAIAWNATAGVVQLAVAALSNVGTGNVVCTGGPLPATAVVVTFVGSLGNTAQNVMTHSDSLTGGSAPAVAITHTTTGIAVVNHTARATLAKAVLNGTGPSIFQWSLAVSDNATVQGDFDSATLTTSNEVQAASDIQFQMNSIFSSFS